MLVYFFGRGFCIGAGSEKWFDGTAHVSTQDVLVATFNYRLGPLGFLVDDELATTYNKGNGGMNGVRDGLTALMWLKANVADFGGDPDRLTPFGQSAGGYSVCILMASAEAAAR